MEHSSRKSYNSLAYIFHCLQFYHILIVVPKYPIVLKQVGIGKARTEAPEDVYSDAGGQISKHLRALQQESYHSNNARCQNVTPCKTAKFT